jgi:hypothetical protein
MIWPEPAGVRASDPVTVNPSGEGFVSRTTTMPVVAGKPVFREAAGVGPVPIATPGV